MLTIGTATTIAYPGDILSVRLPNGKLITARAANTILSGQVLVYRDENTGQYWAHGQNTQATILSNTRITRHRPSTKQVLVYPFKTLSAWNYFNLYKSGDDDFKSLESLNELYLEEVGFANIGKNKKDYIVFYRINNFDDDPEINYADFWVRDKNSTNKLLTINSPYGYNPFYFAGGKGLYGLHYKEGYENESLDRDITGLTNLQYLSSVINENYVTKGLIDSFETGVKIIDSAQDYSVSEGLIQSGSFFEETINYSRNTTVTNNSNTSNIVIPPPKDGAIFLPGISSKTETQDININVSHALIENKYLIFFRYNSEDKKLDKIIYPYNRNQTGSVSSNYSFNYYSATEYFLTSGWDFNQSVSGEITVYYHIPTHYAISNQFNALTNTLDYNASVNLTQAEELDIDLSFTQELILNIIIKDNFTHYQNYNVSGYISYEAVPYTTVVRNCNYVLFLNTETGQIFESDQQVLYGRPTNIYIGSHVEYNYLPFRKTSTNISFSNNVDKEIKIPCIFLQDLSNNLIYYYKLQKHKAIATTTIYKSGNETSNGELYKTLKKELELEGYANNEKSVSSIVVNNVEETTPGNNIFEYYYWNKAESIKLPVDKSYCIFLFASNFQLEEFPFLLLFNPLNSTKYLGSDSFLIEAADGKSLAKKYIETIATTFSQETGTNSISSELTIAESYTHKEIFFSNFLNSPCTFYVRKNNQLYLLEGTITNYSISFNKIANVTINFTSSKKCDYFCFDFLEEGIGVIYSSNNAFNLIKAYIEWGYNEASVSSVTLKDKTIYIAQNPPNNELSKDRKKHYVDIYKFDADYNLIRQKEKCYPLTKTQKNSNQQSVNYLRVNYYP